MPGADADELAVNGAAFIAHVPNQQEQPQQGGAEGGVAEGAAAAECTGVAGGGWGEAGEDGGDGTAGNAASEPPAAKRPRVGLGDATPDEAGVETEPGQAHGGRQGAGRGGSQGGGAGRGRGVRATASPPPPSPQMPPVGTEARIEEQMAGGGVAGEEARGVGNSSTRRHVFDVRSAQGVAAYWACLEALYSR